MPRKVWGGLVLLALLDPDDTEALNSMVARGVGVRYNHSCDTDGVRRDFFIPEYPDTRWPKRADKTQGVIPQAVCVATTVGLVSPFAFDKENLKWESVLFGNDTANDWPSVTA